MSMIAITMIAAGLWANNANDDSDGSSGVPTGAQQAAAVVVDPNAELLNNPILHAAAINSIPGRYDNLPRLPNSRAGNINAWQDVAAPYNMEAARLPPNPLRGRAPLDDIMPVDLGAMPQVRKGTGTQLPDPLGDTGIGANLLKPRKRESLYTQVDEKAYRLPSQYTPSHLRAHDYAENSSKLNSGSGALNGFSSADTYDFTKVGAPGDPMVGFARGEIQTAGMVYDEHGNMFNGRLSNNDRFHRNEEIKRSQIQLEADGVDVPLRFAMKTATTGEMGIPQYGHTTQVRMARNADVHDASRAPVPTDRIGSGPMVVEEVVMKYSNRDNGIGAQYASINGGPALMGPEAGVSLAGQYQDMGTERSWIGPGGGNALNAEQLDDRLDAQRMELDTNRSTVRSGTDSNWARTPMPGKAPGGGLNGSYGASMLSRPLVDTTVMGRAGGGGRPMDYAADVDADTSGDVYGERVFAQDLRHTLKSDPATIFAAEKHAPLASSGMWGMHTTGQHDVARHDVRRMQPDVQRELDMTMLRPFLENPYTQPVLNGGFNQAQMPLAVYA